MKTSETKPSALSEDGREIVGYLAFLPPAPYTDWLKVGNALTNAYAGDPDAQPLEGLALFLAWASQAANFDHASCVELWKANALTRINLPWLLKQAQAKGHPDMHRAGLSLEAIVTRFDGMFQALQQSNAGKPAPQYQQTPEEERQRREIFNAAKCREIESWRPAAEPLSANAYLRRKFSEHLPLLQSLYEGDSVALSDLQHCSNGFLRAIVRDIDGVAQGVQAIDPATPQDTKRSAKKFYGQMKGHFMVIGPSLATTQAQKGRAYLVEGIADALTLYLVAAHRPIASIVVTFYSANIPELSTLLPQRYPDILFNGVADNDHSGTGIKAYADAAFPVFLPDFTDIARKADVCKSPTDVNDMLQLTSPEVVRTLLSSAPFQGDFVTEEMIDRPFISPDENPLPLRPFGTVLCSPMGSGKTRYFRSAIGLHRDATPEAAILVLAAGVNLCKMLARDLQFDCYLDYRKDGQERSDARPTSTEDIRASRALVITPNSLYKVDGVKYTLILADECETVLADVSHGTFFTGKSRHFYHQLITMAGAAQSTILADAFTSRVTDTFVARMKIPFHVITNTHQSHRGHRLDLCNEEKTDFVEMLALEAAIAAAEGTGPPVVIACYSKRILRDVFAPLLPEDSFHLITADDTRDIAHINRDPAYVDSKPVLLYTSALSNGYNLPVHHFKKAYGIFNDGLFTAAECMQMMGRLREITHFIMGASGVYKGQTVDKDSIRRRFLKRCQIAGSATKYGKSVSTVTDTITLDMMVAVESFRASHRQGLRTYIHGGANMMGFDTTLLHPTREEASRVKEYRATKRLMRKQREEKLQALIATLLVMDKTAYAAGLPEVTDTREITEEDELILLKSRLYHDLRVRDADLLNTLTVETYLHKLMDHIVFCGNYLMSDRELDADDRRTLDAQENNRLKAKSAQFKAYRKLMQHMGISAGLGLLLNKDGSPIEWWNNSPAHDAFVRDGHKMRRQLWVHGMTESADKGLSHTVSTWRMEAMVTRISRKGIVASSKYVEEIKDRGNGLWDYTLEQTRYTLKPAKLALMQQLGVNWVVLTHGSKALRDTRLKARDLAPDADDPSATVALSEGPLLKPNMKKLMKGSPKKRSRTGRDRNPCSFKGPILPANKF